MKILFTLFLFLSFSASAEVSRTEVEGMIDEMVRSNMISAEEAQKAKLRVRAPTQREVSRMPASVSNPVPSKKELSQIQFEAIENDLKALAPDYLARHP